MLAHCPTCDLWLAPNETCLHIGQDTSDCLANPLPRTGFLPLPVHTSPRPGSRRAGDLLRGTWPTPGEGMGIGHDQENSHA